MGVLLISAHGAGRIKEVAYLLLIAAGLGLVVAQFARSAIRGALIVAGLALVLAGVLLVIATHWGSDGTVHEYLRVR